VWLKDPDDGTEHDEVGLQLVLTAGIEGAEMGIHVMRNVFCQFYNEKIEVLADRYQRCVGRTPKHLAAEPGRAPEISFDVMLRKDHEVKKNGCDPAFPFFIVPSLLDKKMSGPFSLTIYADKPIVIQQLDDESRKL
jgi:hypothetical protein